MPELRTVRKSSDWPVASGPSEIPIWRYLLYVGGALLALLFAADAVLPRPPTDTVHASGSQLPKIRVQSEHKGPEAVVIDANRFTIMADVTGTADVPAAVAILGPPDPGFHESFAQLLPSAPKQADAAQPKKRQTRPRPRGKAGMGRHKDPPRQAGHSAFGWLESGW